MPTAQLSDHDAMRHALTLAERGWGRVHPNPLVGAVVVRGGEIVGEGWHDAFGAPHAEPVALAAAGQAAAGATLYVTLEPCIHHGKTPPCTDAIIAAGITRVVVALADPNPVAAGGLARLAQHGIAVESGLLREAAACQNARFLHQFSGSNRPLVGIKLAVSMDGMIADAACCSRWISGVEARGWVHWERAGWGAIGVGAATAIRDDARLTVRGSVVPRVAPHRVIFDRSGLLPTSHGIFADAADVPLVVVTSAGQASHREALMAAGAEVLVAESLGEALEQLARLSIDSLLIEGGGRLAGALLREQLVDRVYQVMSPVWLGEGVAAWAGLGSQPLGSAARWRTVSRRALGDDTLLVLER